MTAVLLEKPGALSAAINSYISGVSYYLRNISEDPDEDLEASDPMCTARRRLQAWDRPAETREEAIYALRFALAEAVEHDASLTIAPMLKAALRTLDDRHDTADRVVGCGSSKLRNLQEDSRQVPLLLPRLKLALAVQRAGIRLAEWIAPELSER